MKHELATGDVNAGWLNSKVALVPECITAPTWLMRDDSVTTLTPLVPTLAAVFASFSLDGVDGIPQAGEGADATLPGSMDDDRAYIENPPFSVVDPDASVATDPRRPLVFYRISDRLGLLRVTKDAGGIRIDWAP